MKETRHFGSATVAGTRGARVQINRVTGVVTRGAMGPIVAWAESDEAARAQVYCYVGALVNSD